LPTVQFHNSAGGTSAAIDTTGMNLIVAAIQTAGTMNFSDSKSNTWTALTQRTEPVLSWATRLYYCSNPTVGTGHTFSTTSANVSMYVASWSGGHASSQFGAESGSNAAQPGNMIPSEDNCLFVTSAINLFADDYAIDSSFTIIYENGDNEAAASVVGGGMAYKIQTTAGAENPTWSNPGGGGWPSYGDSMAYFKAAAAGGAGPTNPDIQFGRNQIIQLLPR
jgi:hypothetical protein